MKFRYSVYLIPGLLLSLLPGVPVSAQTDQSFVADLVYQVQQLQEEVRQLRGKVEQQAHVLEGIKSRQRDQYLDLDGRLSELKAQGVNKNTQGLNSQSAGVLLAPPAVKVSDNPEATTANTGALVTATPPVAAATTQSPVAAALDDKAAYQQAFTHLKELRYTEAAESYYAFLETYPNSPLAGNAQYWLGESYYVTRNYDFALEAFQKLLEKYPDSKKVPDAWLKIGYTYYEMKDYAKAADILNRVKQEYPDSTLAKLADSRLKTMQLENATGQ